MPLLAPRRRSSASVRSEPSRRQLALGVVLFFGAGATLVLVTLLLPHRPDTNELGVAVPPLVAYSVVALALGAGSRMSLRAWETILVLGAILVTGCVYFGGRSAEAYSLMYVWVALYAYAFFPALDATLVTAVAAACYAIVLATTDVSPVPWVAWVMSTGTIFVAGALIARLAVEVRAQAADLQAAVELGRTVTFAENAGTVRRMLCEAALAACDGDVAVLVERGGVETRVGDAELGAGLATQVRGRDAAAGPLTTHDGRCSGLAQNVLHEGRTTAVLAVGWHEPRRRVADRLVRALSLFAAEAAAVLERARRISGEHERRALELNDNVVQGLVVARYALDAGRTGEAERAVQETLARARGLMSEQLDALGPDVVRPGDLRRRTAA